MKLKTHPIDDLICHWFVIKYSKMSKSLQKYNSIMDLGVIIDKSIRFLDHFSGVTNKARQMLGFKEIAGNSISLILDYKY